jgi:hypothetical protein
VYPETPYNICSFTRHAERPGDGPSETLWNFFASCLSLLVAKKISLLMFPDSSFNKVTSCGLEELGSIFFFLLPVSLKLHGREPFEH